jgi:hypothetical protein
MKQKNWGRIINLASVHGLVGSAGKSAYVAAKHGLVGFTKVTALENAHTGVTCNAICPGWVLTPLVQKQVDDRAARDGVSNEQAKKALLSEKQPSGEFVTPEELGALAVFFCSPAATRCAAWPGTWMAAGPRSNPFMTERLDDQELQDACLDLARVVLAAGQPTVSNDILETLARPLPPRSRRLRPRHRPRRARPQPPQPRRVLPDRRPRLPLMGTDMEWFRQALVCLVELAVPGIALSDKGGAFPARRADGGRAVAGGSGKLDRQKVSAWQ